MKLNVPADTYQPDPFVIYHNNMYYMYASHSEGVHLYESSDMINWIDKGYCYKRENRKEYWAPSVIFYDNKFYLYVSTCAFDIPENEGEAMEVAVSDNPVGPFKFCNTLIKPFSIDSHVVLSGKSLYIIYSFDDLTGDHVGTTVGIDKMKSPFEVCGNPKILIHGSIEEEIFQKDRFKKGQDWYTIEGGFYFRNGNDHFIMYSANCYMNENYFIGYAHAYGDTFELLDLDFKKYPSDYEYDPLMRKNEVEEGTGHNSVLFKDNTYYVFYHGRDTKDELILGTEQRTARFAIMEVRDHKLVITKR